MFALKRPLLCDFAFGYIVSVRVIFHFNENETLNLAFCFLLFALDRPLAVHSAYMLCGIAHRLS